MSSVPPSAEVLGEAARRVADAYPSLYAHQRTGIAFLLSRRRAILADDMGLGKTRQAIIALREAQPAGPFLVVCPAGVKLTWLREIRAVEPDADVQVVGGSTTPAAGHRWTVVTYDILGRHRAALAAIGAAGIVMDEAHYLKNDSARSRHALRLAGVGGAGDEPEALYLLTGTPMTNRPRDLFNLLRAIRHPLATSFYSYAKRYCAAFDNGYGLDSRGASNLEELAEVLSGVMLRRSKDEVLDLPPKLRTWQPIAVDSAAVRRAESQALRFLEADPAGRARAGPSSWGCSTGRVTRSHSPRWTRPWTPSRSASRRARRWWCSAASRASSSDLPRRSARAPGRSPAPRVPRHARRTPTRSRPTRRCASSWATSSRRASGSP
ncbi:MAG: SNF2-related protein [Chloroflexota bacterium]